MNKLKKFSTFDFKSSYKGFEGLEFDLCSYRNIRIIAHQTDLNYRKKMEDPVLKVVLEDSIKNSILRYSYFFDIEGTFILGIATGLNKDTKQNIPHSKVGLSYLIEKGESIENILRGQPIPYELLQYKIIAAMRDNLVAQRYKDE